MLRWEDGAPSVEAQIESHLREKELIVQREREAGQEYLMLAYGGQRVPDFLLLVRANRGTQAIGDTSPPQYLLVVQLRTFTKIPSSRISVALEALNAFNAQWAYGAFYLDRAQEEVMGVWPIRATAGSPLPLEVVYDAIVMLVQNWYDLHAILVPAELESAPPDAAPLLPKDAGPVSRAAQSRRFTRSGQR